MFLLQWYAIKKRRMNYRPMSTIASLKMLPTHRRSKGWVGKIKGQPATSGVYIFISSVVDYQGKPMIRKGTVMADSVVS